MVLRADEILSLQNTVASFMPETGVSVVRTGVTTICRIRNITSFERLPNMPLVFHLPAWELWFRSGTDVSVGDTVIAPGRGTYHVFDTSNPSSYSTSNIVKAIQFDMEWTPPLLPTGVATFRQRGSQESIANVSVRMTPMSRQDEIAGWAAGFTYVVAWNANTRFSDLQPIGTDDTILWIEDAHLPQRSAKIKHPRRYPSPFNEIEALIEQV